MKYFHGNNKRARYFEGWYFRCAAKEEAFVFIPGISIDEKGRRRAFLQVATSRFARTFRYPFSDFHASEKALFIRVGSSRFSAAGLSVDLREQGFDFRAELDFGSFAPPAYSAMGPLALLPFLECAHEVVSMLHTVRGRVYDSGTLYALDEGRGYIEKDRGNSFPKSYSWAQGSCGNTSVMAAAATLPLFGREPTGTVAIIKHGEEELRFASYLGARVLRQTARGVLIAQGKNALEITCLGGRAFPLDAPQGGSMKRVIHERPLCPVRFRLYQRNRLVFSMLSRSAAYETTL